MSKELLERAKKIKERNAILVTIQGSGFHDSDRMAPQNQGGARADTHVVRFQDDRGDLHFVGEDAKRACEAVKIAAKKLEKLPRSSLTGSQLRVVNEFPQRYSATTKIEGSEHFVVWHEDWNDYVMAMDIAGVGHTGAMIKES